MGAVWSALLVGGGLAGALVVWLLRGDHGDPGKDGDTKQDLDGPLGEAAAPGGDLGGGGLSPGSKREPITKPEHLQGHNGHLISETKGRGNLQEAAWRLQSPGEDCDGTREHAPSEALAASEAGHTRDSSEVPKNERLGGWGFQKGREMLSKAAACLVEKLPSSNLLMNRDKGEASLAQPGSPDRAEQDGWEMVSRHSSWGDVSLGGSLEASVLSLSQEMDHGRHTLVEARGWEGDGKAMSSGSQRVRVRFQVHYVPSADGQLVAVTGNHESLGRWKTCIPLQHGKDGFWSRSVLLPADAVMEWKFVLVQNGKVIRWEECSNRFLETGREDKVVHKWWGFP